ncbi:pentatricopeptide repeat-containing protein At1g08070, chloroplastic-like [Cynara cardunculus var. scolymus]|uniref:Pentatricopeptide repeat-containing protein n=1 Tax=Cynara cardunculus var. scolymus TaxID=59895 RepID=A0A118JZP7_CYNCS|nr:pentatricopeptide repeat-containing protein At1g08070, chloroplastic-like [Cynara cardunculus var. scolymus]KVI00210.1 Pentatricopeptide repeat-containing protein [Cynara cardunculus var. scolymus]
MPKKPLLHVLSSKQVAQIKAHVLKSSRPHELNELLDSFVKSHTPQHAFVLYNQMLQNPNTHNHFSFNYALKACCLTNSFNKGREIHARVVKSGHLAHTYIQNSFVHFYVIRNDIVYANRVFRTIAYPNVVSWTSIISGFSKCGFVDDAVAMFSLMDVDPNANTLVSVLSACSSVRSLKLGKSVHCYGLKSFDQGNVIFDNALLHFYVKVGDLENAQRLFDEMPKRDVVSWSTMVGGFVEWGFCETAINVFNEMVKGGEVNPNVATIVNLLAACASLGSLSLCEWVHSYVHGRHDIPVDGNIGNALVNSYVKCGNISKAIRVFKTLRLKDKVSWSTMISGVAMNGLGHHALPLFSLMLVNGVAPDDVTFIGLLTACSHAGLVDEGLMVFKAMVNAYGITPHKQHYGCVVDLYARGGRFREAEDFIRGMVVEPDAPVWGALVSGCRVHGNEVILKRVGQAVVDRGASGGTLASVSNSYAGSSRWDESIEIRKTIGCLGLKKMAGCSWIELDE